MTLLDWLTKEIKYAQKAYDKGHTCNYNHVIATGLLEVLDCALELEDILSQSKDNWDSFTIQPLTTALKNMREAIAEVDE